MVANGGMQLKIGSELDCQREREREIEMNGNEQKKLYIQICICSRVQLLFATSKWKTYLVSDRCERVLKKVEEEVEVEWPEWNPAKHIGNYYTKQKNYKPESHRYHIKIYVDCNIQNGIFTMNEKCKIPAIKIYVHVHQGNCSSGCCYSSHYSYFHCIFFI